MKKIKIAALALAMICVGARASAEFSFSVMPVIKSILASFSVTTRKPKTKKKAQS